jgi:hypothetical protein
MGRSIALNHNRKSSSDKERKNMKNTVLQELVASYLEEKIALRQRQYAEIIEDIEIFLGSDGAYYSLSEVDAMSREEYETLKPTAVFADGKGNLPIFMLPLDLPTKTRNWLNRTCPAVLKADSEYFPLGDYFDFGLRYDGVLTIGIDDHVDWCSVTFNFGPDQYAKTKDILLSGDVPNHFRVVKVEI